MEQQQQQKKLFYFQLAFFGGDSFIEQAFLCTQVNNKEPSTPIRRLHSVLSPSTLDLVVISRKTRGELIGFFFPIVCQRPTFLGFFFRLILFLFPTYSYL